ncbi:MAG: helix-turn-helix transcriptional regulator, partial [Rhizobacter sp.]|nr:helix-turn-helix transcriptional regulator [Chlorobiales bacterium]
FFWPEHTSPLTLMINFSGYSEHRTPHARFRLGQQGYLIFNHGQEYSNQIHSEVEVDAMRLVLMPAFAEGALTNLTTPSDKLLDQPDDLKTSPLSFYEKVYPHDGLLSPVFARMKAAIDSGLASPLWEAEQFHHVAARLVQVHERVRREISEMPAVKAATRAELYRRLNRAKEFIDASAASSIELSEVSKVACLSTHHFLRLFKAAFHQTPHQYLTARRLEMAKFLMSRTQKSITEICFDVGFESLGAFSTLFRSHTGLSPKQFRAHT